MGKLSILNHTDGMIVSGLQPHSGPLKVRDGGVVAREGRVVVAHIAYDFSD